MRASAAEVQPSENGDESARERILHETLRLLEDRGYAAVTTDAIAAEARVSKATLYQYWSTKQEVVVEAARLRFGPVEAPDLGSFEDEIRWILEHRLDDYRQPGTLRLVGGLVGAATSDPELKAVFEEWIDQLSSAIRQVTERGVARGEVRADIDPFAIESLVAGIVSRCVITQRSFSPSIIDELAGLISSAAVAAPETIDPQRGQP